MVDPNRKINRLTDKDIEFLDECEDEFGNRYTEDDTEFMEHQRKPLADPPIVDNWLSGGYNNRGDSSSFSGNRNHYGGVRNRGWNNRRGGGGGGPYRNHFRRGGYKPYAARGHDDGGGKSSGGGSASYGSRREDPKGNDRNDRPPMIIPRDYGNFVPASRD